MAIDFSTSYWQGTAVRLRALEPSDWKVYFAWNQDDAMARRLLEIPFPQSQEAVKQWAEKESTRRREDDNCRFVIENTDAEVVGDLTTHLCDPRTGAFFYGLHVHKAHRRKGYAKEAIAIVLRYYFYERRYQKVMAAIYSFNEASIRLHESLGFQREGQWRRMGYSEGQYFDHLFYGLTVEEFAANHPHLPLG